MELYYCDWCDQEYTYPDSNFQCKGETDDFAFCSQKCLDDACSYTDYLGEMQDDR